MPQIPVGETGRFGPADWDDIRLVIFDVDGTLYRQQPLRVRMTRDILLHTLGARDLNVLKIVSRYRKLRERLADARVENFEDLLIDTVAQETGKRPDQVRGIITEWLEQRPLPYLAGCVYPGLAELFRDLRRRRKTIGVLSDYPVEAKLLAMGLAADCTVCAADPTVGVLKPHPRGLQHLMAVAGAEPGATLMIGDRPERDGVAAREAGVRVIIRSSRPIDGWQTFKRFDDELFKIGSS